MPVVAVLGGDAPLRAVLRRGLPAGVRLRSCATADAVDGLLRHELVDAIVIRARGRSWLAPAGEWHEAFPRVPLFAFAPVRADDGRTLAEAMGCGVRTVLVRGVDEPVAGELVAARTASHVRARELGEAVGLLRLREELQRRAWEFVLRGAGDRLTTGDVARALRTSREHLSREFAAGGAPNLKRVIDLARVASAADLLRNPGYDAATCAAVLRFANAAHLATAARRIAGAAPAELPGLGPRGVLLRFLHGRTRSRM